MTLRGWGREAALVLCVMLTVALMSYPGSAWSSEDTPRLVVPVGHSSAVQQVLFTPDGRYLISRDYDELKVWETWTGCEVRTVLVKGPISILPDGETVLSGTKEGLRLWNLWTGEIIREFGTNDDRFLSADGRVALSAYRDSILKVWDLATGTSLNEIGPCPGQIYIAALDPSLERLFVGGDGFAGAAGVRQVGGGVVVG